MPLPSRLRLAVLTHEFPTVENPQTGRVLWEVSRHLRAYCDVHCFCLTPKYSSLPFLQPRSFSSGLAGQDIGGVPVDFITFPAIPWLTRPLNSWTCFRKAERCVTEWKPDLILAYFLFPQGCAAVTLGQKLRIPVTLGALGSDLLRIPNRFIQSQVSRALRKAAAVLAVSNDLVARAIALGADPRRSLRIQNGCDQTVFRPRDRKTVRSQLGVAPDERLILFVGRLVELKGVQDLLAAIPMLRFRTPPARVVCIGDGPLRTAYSASAQEFGITDKLTLLGSRTAVEVSSWLAAADLLCLPSYSEGSPSVILESLACGTPVVATRVGGIPDLVDHRWGRLVDPGQPTQLAQAIDEVLDCSWDPIEIGSHCQRPWADVAKETFDLCVRSMSKH